MKTEDTEGPEHSDYCGFAGGPILPGQSCFCANQTKATIDAANVKDLAYSLRSDCVCVGGCTLCEGADVLEQQQAEIERLHSAFDGMSARYDDAESEVHSLRAELKKYKHAEGCNANRCAPDCEAS
jgi:hypothetical protein